MADRSIVIKLKAIVSDFTKGMSEAGKAAKGAAGEMEAAGTKSQAFGRTAINESTKFLAFGLALTAVTRGAGKSFDEFDQAMSGVAATGADARNNIEALTAAALDFGADTAYNATECANAIEELAKAGLSAADILNGGLAGALNLAASEGMNIAEAASIAATAMQQFGLDGGQASHVADLLAAGAGKAMGSAQDLGQALKQGGLIASQMGLSIEETTAALAAFAQQGLIGSDAGTSLKTMLQRLSNPSKEAKSQMEALGISAYDAAGNFVGLEALAGQLADGMAALTPEARNAAMAVMFGSDAVRSANVLYQEGATGIADWLAAVDDWGYAAEAARVKTDNLRGDLERLGGAWDTIAISSGSGLNGMFRGAVQEATELLDIIGKIPAPVLSTVTALVGLGGVASLAIGAFGKLAGTLNEFTKLSMLSTDSASKLMGALSGIGKVAGVVALSLAAFKVGDSIGNLIGGKDTAGNIGEIGNAMQRFAHAKDEAAKGQALDEIFTFDYSRFDGARGMADALRDLKYESSGLLGASNNLRGFFKLDNDIDVITEQVDAFDDRLAEMVRNGYADQAREAAEAFWDEATYRGHSGVAADKMLNDYFVAQEEAAINTEITRQEQEAAALGMEAYAASVGQTGDSVTKAAEAYGLLDEKGKEAANSIFLSGVGLVDTMAIVKNFGGDAETAAKQFTDMAKGFADSAASISNSANAWDEARGKAEQPPSMESWIAAMEKQAEAFENLKANTLSAFEQMRTELPATMQDIGEAFLMSIQGNAGAMEMFANATDAQQLAMIETWARTGEYAGGQYATNLAAAIMGGGPVTVEVVTETGTALAQVAGLRAAIEDTTGTVTILGDDGQARAVLSGCTAAINSADGTITIYGQDGQARATLENYKASVDATTGVVTISGNDATGRQIVYAFKGSIDATTGQVSVTADTSAAQGAINGLKNQSISLPVTLYPTNSVTGLTGGFSHKADGGIVQRFAAGGFTTAARVPQIVKGGANILWGEPETGWEAYISGKPSMRGRNLAILDEVANRLDHQLIPLATGGIIDNEMRAKNNSAIKAYGSATASAVPPVVVAQLPQGLRLVGTLDLGDGLTGRIEATALKAFDSELARGYARVENGGKYVN